MKTKEEVKVVEPEVLPVDHSISNMSDEQEQHLNDIINAFVHDVDQKYRKGQAEHGGDLWKKGGMVKFMREETLDFIVYCHTLAQQLRMIEYYLETCANNGHKFAEPALGMVRALLSTEPEDETGGTNARG